jgi:hypothetical protein
VEGDPDYNLTRQKKVYLQLAHLNFTLACNSHSLELAFLKFASKKLRMSVTIENASQRLDVYNDLSFKYSSLSIMTQNDSRVLGSAENAPYDKFNSTQLYFDTYKKKYN